MNYIKGKIYGLPKPKHEGYDTRYKHELPEYVHRVEINGSQYYKVQIKRGEKSKTKYFKNIEEAEIFVEMLRINKYL